MSLFRQHASTSITEGDLIAFHLHELTPRREEAVLRAIESNPSLAAESDAIAASLNALRVKDTSMHINQTVLDRNWKALRPSLTPYILPPLQAPRWHRPVFAAALVATAATLTFLIATHHLSHTPRTDPAAITASGSGLAPASSTPPRVPGQEDLSKLPQLHLLTLNPSSGIIHPQPQHPYTPPSLPSSPATPPPVDATPNPEPILPLKSLSASATEEPPLTSAPFHEPPSTPERGPANPSGNARPHGSARSAHKHELDLMLAIGGTFIAPHTSLVDGTVQSTQNATHAVAALAAIHQQFRRALGYRVTASYTLPDFLYSSGNNSVDLNSRIYELASTYVVEGPRRSRFRVSADAGAGLLAFLPTLASQSPRHVYRAAGILGVNLDYAITRHWGARAAYRAQVYKSPDFSSPDNFIPSTNSITVSNEPSLGITYLFGKN